MNKTRKGFTLVELLIVIVVIGILSAMMMLSSSEAVTSAKASNIASNLRNLKTAAHALYADKEAYYSAKPDEAPSIDDVCKYLNGKSKIKEGDVAKYQLWNGGANGWYVCYNAYNSTEAGTEGKKIGQKLGGRAASLRLYDMGAGNAPGAPTKIYDGASSWVGLQVR